MVYVVGVFVLVVLFTIYLFLGKDPEDTVYSRIIREEGEYKNSILSNREDNFVVVEGSEESEYKNVLFDEVNLADTEDN